MNSSAFGLLCLGVGGLQPKLAAAANADYVAPELHINIWERKAWPGPFAELKAFLDIGMMFDIEESMTSVELVFPWEVKQANLIDLYGRVANPDGIAAVFNEGWVIGHAAGDSIVTAPGSTDKNFAIVNAFDRQGGPASLNAVKHGSHHAISVNVQALRARAKNAAAISSASIKRFYVRFRILDVKRDFYCVGETEKLRGFVPSWQRTDVIDFRVNVRRGVPQGIDSTVGGWFLQFYKVQLFLMRTRDQDIIFQDKLFISCRSLEDEEFWAQYAAEPTVSGRDINALVKRSLGYQWKDSGTKPASVTEFGILARFKIVEFGWLWFVAVALMLGALGNGSWDLFKGYIWDPLPSITPNQAICVNSRDIVNQAKQECLPGSKNQSSGLKKVAP